MLRKVISLLFVLVFLGWVGWYVSRNTREFAAIATVRWGELASLLAAFLTIILCNGVFIRIVTAAFDIRLRSAEWGSLSFVSSFANYFLPFRGGAGLRAYYLSRMHALPISAFASTLGVMYLMHIVTNGLMAVAGMVLLMAQRHTTSMVLLLFFTLLSMAGIVAMTVNVSFSVSYRRFPLAQLQRLLTAVQEIKRDRALLVKLWLLMMLVTGAAVWQCAVAFQAASVPISWSGILVYAASKNLATLISLTPGSLGIVELISVYLGTVLDYGTPDALLVQGLIRAVSVVALLVIGPLCLLYLHRKLAKAEIR